MRHEIMHRQDHLQAVRPLRRARIFAGFCALPSCPLLLLVLLLPVTIHSQLADQAAKPGSVWAWGLLKSSVTVPPDALQDVSSLVASGNTVIAIRGNGSVVAWGNRLSGDITQSLLRNAVVSRALQEVGVRKLAVSLAHMVALLKNGTVVAYGSNGLGQLNIPSSVQSNPDVIDVGASTRASYAMLRNGTCIAWGDTSGMPVLFNIKSISGDLIFTMALTNDGQVLQWQHPSYQGTYVHPPVPPEAASGVQQISTSLTRSLALVNGGVIAWGNQGTMAPVPDVVKSNVQAIASGNTHDLALLNNGTVVAWGESVMGATTVPADASLGVSAIAAGTDLSLALREGSVIAWGDAQVWLDASDAIPADLLASRDVVKCSAGLSHVVCLKSDGSVVAFGNDSKNQTFITREISRNRFKAVAAGYEYSLAVTVGGTVKAWGPADLWQTPAEALSDVTAVAAGSDFASALLSSGQIISWGDKQINTSVLPPDAVIKALSVMFSNVLALLDDGSVVALQPGNPGVPTIVFGDVPGPFDMQPPEVVSSGVKAVAAGADHSLALLENGTVVAWGASDRNQTAIHGLSGVRAIAAGADHSVAILNNGTVRVFGDKQYKQDQVPPQALAGVLDVTAGATFTVVIYDPDVALPADAAPRPIVPTGQLPGSIESGGASRSTADASSSSSRKLPAGAIAGIAVGAGVLGVILCVAVFVMMKRSRAWKRMDRLLPSYLKSRTGASMTNSQTPPDSGYGKDGHTTTGVGADSAWVLSSPHGHHAMIIPGLEKGELFTRATAQNYQWVGLTPDATSHVPVEAGVNDFQLDSLAGSEGRVAGSSPAVELTSAQVRQQVQLLRDGLLGRGATGLVFAGMWPGRFGPNALLAVKVLKDGYEMDTETLQSFAYETSVLAAANHPNVVRLYGFCLEPPTVCLIMELLPHSLKDVLYQKQPRPLFFSPRSSYAPTFEHSNTGTLSGERSVYTGSASYAAHSMTSSTLDGRASVAQDTRGSDSSVQYGPSASKSMSQFASMSGSPFLSAATASSQAWLVGAAKRPTMMQVLQISTDIAAGLEYLHEKPSSTALSTRLKPDAQPGSASEDRDARIVHRDLKPANILIDSQGRAKISDFGLARKHTNTTVETERVGAGTLPYQAPELLTSAFGGGIHQSITNRVDIYSMGIIMWEMLAGQPPWKGSNMMAVVAAVTARRRPELPDLKQQPSASGPPPVHTDPVDYLTGVADNRRSDAGGAAQVGGGGASGESQPAGPLEPASLHSMPELNALIKQCWEHRELRRPTAAQLHQTLVELSQKLVQSMGPSVSGPA